MKPSPSFQTKGGTTLKKQDMSNDQLSPHTPVALYARVSSDRQDVDLSIAAQLRALRDHAEKNNYVVTAEYVDEAESGRIAERPEFRKMLDAATGPDAPFKEILVWKFSRFTRKREHAVAFKSMLRRKGIRVVSITEHADDSPTGKLMEAIIESVDEFYSENLAQEVMRGMREAAARGYYLAGKAPFGYNRVKVKDGNREHTTLEIDAPTAVRREGDVRPVAARPWAEGNLHGTQRPRRHEPRKALVQVERPLRPRQRDLHGHGHLGPHKQGRTKAGSGPRRERMASHRLA